MNWSSIIKQNISRMLFLVYFSIYAVSPLSLTLTSQNALEICSSNSPNPPTKNLHIFMWEIIFSKLTKCNDTGNDHAGAGIKALIKKARAILPEDIGKISSSLQKASLNEPISFHTIEILPQYFPDNEIRQTTKAISSLYACHSPPFYKLNS